MVLPYKLRRLERRAVLLQALCAVADVDAKSTRAAELRKAQRQALLAALTAWPVNITGHEGYMKVPSFHDLLQMSRCPWLLQH